MKYNKSFFNHTLKLHKIFISDMWKKQDIRLLTPIEKTADELCLLYAEFKCEKCKTGENLQYHHLIPRRIKLFTDKWRYHAQRQYWGNIIILCVDCHMELENRKPSNVMPMTIPRESIDAVKKKYGVE
jgi:5-methylcytosine-specific restriction endonuclease McrA